MNPMLSIRRVAIVGLLLVLAAGCGSDSKDSSSSGTSSSKTELVGTHWLLEDSTDLPTNGVSVTAEFVDTRIGGTSGCNTYNAPFVVDGSKLTIGPNIASTQMACEPGPMAVETSYLERLPNVAEYKIDGTKLELLDNNGKTLLTYKAVDGASAILGEWTATGIYTGDAIKSPVVGSNLTANFADKEVSGDSGCNTFGGPYTVKKNTIKLGPFRSTLRACVDEAVSTQEGQYLQALELAKTFKVTGDQLQLLRDDGGIAATFVRTAVVG